MTDAPTYPIIELQPGWLLHQEQMGSKDKHWVSLPNDSQPWLFKFSRESAGHVTGEHWAEKVAAEVARLLGVPHARVELATLDGHWGAISRQFDELALTPQDLNRTELVHGNDLLAGHVVGYDRNKHHKQSDHTLTNVLSVAQTLFTQVDQRDQALQTLAGYLVLDALILNTDRHHENWGVLRRVTPNLVQYAVAPSFDHASSLARNEPPERLSAWLADKSLDRAKWYAERPACRGGIYEHNGDTHGANPLRLVLVAAQQWPRFFEPWRQALATMTPHDLADAVNRVPSKAMSQPSKAFALALMTYTLGQLKTL